MSVEVILSQLTGDELALMQKGGVSAILDGPHWEQKRSTGCCWTNSSSPFSNMRIQFTKPFTKR